MIMMWLFRSCDCDEELLCRRLKKTMMKMMMMMMMIYGCVHRYKYVCVHYQFLSPYWLHHIMIYSCSSTIRCILILYIIILHHTHHPYPHTSYCSVYHYLHIIIFHLISLLPLPSFSSISLCTISYRTVGRLSIQHVCMDMRVPYWYC